MSKDQVWKIISFFHIKRPKQKVLFQTFSGWKMIKLLSILFKTP